MNDLYGQNMEAETEYDWDWGRAQAEDEAIEQRQVSEAFERIYRAISELELLSNAGYPSLRTDVRFIEAVMWRK